MIQQATHQVPGPNWERDFSESSYGFRPGRGARQAVKAAQKHVQSGKRWVVDMDLEKFFDRVNHDVLMARVARKIQDKRLPGLIRRYLQSGMLVGGLMEARSEGTPQGKRSWTRHPRLRQLELTGGHARESAWNGRGPWWNPGAGHLNTALPAGDCQRLGLISLLVEVQWFRKPTGP